MELTEALRTTGSVREFTDEPVSRDVVYDVLDAARFAPNGGNRQAWRVVVVDDPSKKRSLRDCYLPGWHEYLAQLAAGLVPFAPITDEALEARANERAASSAGPGGFAEHLDRVPVLLVLVADLRALAALDKHADRYTFVGGASVYPFAWSILLAARDAGLGGVLTTMAVRREHEVRELLGIDEQFAVAGVIALGHPVHQPTRLRRNSVEAFTTVDSFEGAPLSREAAP